MEQCLLSVMPVSQFQLELSAGAPGEPRLSTISSAKHGSARKPNHCKCEI
jgi:hypothetical protein